MKKLLLGDFAVARGAYEAGVKVATAYPGTPSTEITEELARYDDVYSEWSSLRPEAASTNSGAETRRRWRLPHRVSSKTRLSRLMAFWVS